jgi:hypothetical protein
MGMPDANSVAGHTHVASGNSGNRSGTTSSDVGGYAANTSNDPAYVNMFFIMSLGQDVPRPWQRTPRFNYTLR